MNKIIVSNDFKKSIEKIEFSDKIEVDELKIADVEEIKKLIYLKSEEKRVLLIVANKYNIFAQNALLKILEEDLGVDIIFLAKTKYSLIETIKSRAIIEYHKFDTYKEFDVELIDVFNSDEVIKFLKKDLSKEEIEYFIRLLLEKDLSEDVLFVLSKSLEMLYLNFDKGVVLGLIIMALRNDNESL